MLPSWAERRAFAVHTLTKTRNFRGADIEDWADSGETVTAELQEADDRAVAVAGARGRRMTKLAFVEGQFGPEPETARLVGGGETYLVTEVFGVYPEGHSELGLERVPNP